MLQNPALPEWDSAFERDRIYQAFEHWSIAYESGATLAARKYHRQLERLTDMAKVRKAVLEGTKSGEVGCVESTAGAVGVLPTNGTSTILVETV